MSAELVKFGLSPVSARDVVWEMEYELQQIWAKTISNQYKAYAIVIPNKQKKWLVIWVLEGINGRDRPIFSKSHYSTHI
jgi:hypothetical protein